MTMAQHFGQRLQRIREEQGLTVYEAAKRAGMKSQVLYRLEKFPTLGTVHAATLRKLARVYQTSVDYLLVDVADEEEDSHAA
jgi:transcriptional regulator with XRE-family HTH domain